jgi:hypothetical protein
MTDVPYPDDPTMTKPIIEMLTVANEYCLFFERAETFQAPEIIGFFQKIAPLLYLKAATLPDIAVTDESFNERFVTEEQWETVFKALREKIGSDDLYYMLDQNNDTKQASLADNLADIYQDMKDFIMLYQKGPQLARENAIYQLRYLMATHWGGTLLDALKASHVKVFKNLIDPDILDEDTSWLF